MTEFTLSQEKNQIENLGRDVFHDTAGHNTLTANISGSDLDYVYVELSLNGGDWDSMKEFGPSDFAVPGNRSPDGTAMGDISVREAVSVRWRDDTRDTLQLYFTDHVSGTGGTKLYKAESAGDPTSFSNPQLVYEEPSSENAKVEDPNAFFNPDTGTLNMIYEDGGPSGQSHGWIGILDADTLDGESWGNKRLIGGQHWSPPDLFASPSLFKLNGTYYIGGEDHSGGTAGDLVMAQGTGVNSWTDSTIAAVSSDYPDVDYHVNLQGPVWYSRDGTLYAYTNVRWSDGSWGSAVFYTDQFDSNGYPSNWQLGDRTGYIMGGITRFFNDIYLYAENNKTELVYWHPSGSRIERQLNNEGGDVEFDFYEPTAPQGSTVEWRVAVEDSSGNVERSESEAFGIESPPSVPSESQVATRSLSGVRQTVDGVVQLVDPNA